MKAGDLLAEGVHFLGLNGKMAKIRVDMKDDPQDPVCMEINTKQFEA